MRDLPSLPALLAFAGAARLGSFTAAAKDMGTTQPLISHHVRVLEVEFGRPLFQRRARGVTLTEAGRQLADAVEAGFTEIARVSRALKSDRSRAQVTVATDFGPATYWLLPRLANFRSSNPDIEVRILTTQGPVSPELDADFAIALA